MIGLLLVMMAATAAQRQVDISRGPQQWDFDIRWVDVDGGRHRAQFVLPAAQVRADLDEPLRYRKRDAGREAAQAVRAFGNTKPNVNLRVSVDEAGTIRISASGKNRKRVKAVLAQAAQVRDEALAQYRAENGWSTLDGEIIPDHVRHAQSYADALDPVVDALGGPTADPRDFAELALGFVQSIPYERRALIRDRFRRPLSVLGRNKGDCDSKSTLYLSLLRSAYPEMALAMVYIPNHAFVALGVSPESGDRRLRQRGTTWVIAEPVGPAMYSVGTASRRSARKSRFGMVEMLTVATDG